MDCKKWESLDRQVNHDLHKGYTIHNTWARRHNQLAQVVYNVNGKEMTLRQISERDELDGLQLPLFEVS